MARRAGLPLLTLGLLGLSTVPALAAPTPLAPPPGPAAAAGDAPSVTPCARVVKACARLSTKQAWLTDGNGVMLRGPVQMSHGGKGQETPVGSMKVTRKDATHVSQEQQGTPMPWSVFFDHNGRAFHGGDPNNPSAGCIHLADDDAKFFFDHLNVGDSVEILP